MLLGYCRLFRRLGGSDHHEVHGRLDVSAAIGAHAGDRRHAGAGMAKVFIALAVGFMPTYCRLMCGEVLSTKENDYIMAANVSGQPYARYAAPPRTQRLPSPVRQHHPGPGFRHSF